MKLHAVFAFALFTSTTALAGCTSSTSDDAAPAGPIVDSLDVPAQTSTMTVQGQSGPGVVLTLTAHDDSSGISALHVAFVEANAEQVIEIPSGPTKLEGQKIELVLVNAPKGDHPVGFYLSDAAGHHSATINKTITVL